MIDGMLDNSAFPALERSLRFMSARQRLLVGNLANVETPGFRPVDVDPRRFQSALAEALEAEAIGAEAIGAEAIGAGVVGAGVSGAPRAAADGGLALDESAPVAFTEQGTVLKPEALADNILFHDGNDRSIERLMQRLTENAYAFRMASQLLRSQFDLVNTAIRERP